MDSRGSLHRPLEVVDRIQENSRTISLVLGGRMMAAPGQFAMLWLPGADEKPFSISGADPLEFTISRVGPFSEALAGLRPGDTLWVRGPFGRGFSLEPGSTLLVGGGYGAAPLAFLASTLASKKDSRVIEASLGARAASDLIFLERFAGLGVPVHVTTEDGSAGTAGRVTEVVAPLLASGRFSRVRACGPEGMLEAVAAACRRAAVAAELSFEAYMRCGIGLCGACEHGGRLVCIDGPVFSIPAAAPARI
jgi:dihydroorotate dehydrogenase electron transfer subunit